MLFCCTTQCIYNLRNMADCYLDLGHCHPCLYHSQCCLPPGSQGSSKTSPQCHQTHVVEHEQAFDHDNPLQLLAHLLFQTTPVCRVMHPQHLHNNHQISSNMSHIICKKKKYLLVIRGPYSTGDLALKVDLR